MHKPPPNFRTGFTLAELLITLAILGEIVTFTIPKILSAQANNSYNAKAKEAAAMISEAYQKAQFTGTVDGNTKAADLTQYMNYVTVRTSGSIDSWNTSTTAACDATKPCLVLHNGSVLMAREFYFNGTSSVNLVSFLFDPDGVVTDGTTNGPGKSVQFDLYYNGFITSPTFRKPGATCSYGAVGTCVNCDPSWFSW